MDLRPEQVKAKEYLHEKGTRCPVAKIHERVTAAFAAMEGLLDEVRGPEAGRQPWPGEWSVHEIVDHLVASHRPSIGELRDLLRGRRPSGAPVPAGLQSADPMGRRWEDLVGELKGLHAEALAVLAKAPDDYATDARAPLVMVINAREADGREVPLHWIEELDWKAYAIVFRLHTLDHLNQIRKTLRAARGAA